MGVPYSVYCCEIAKIWTAIQAGGGGGGSYTAGTGLQLTGSQFSIDNTVATLTGAQTLTNKVLTGNVTSNFRNANGDTIVAHSGVNGSVNYPQTYSNTTGGAVGYRAVGADANINIRFEPKGTGVTEVRRAEIGNATRFALDVAAYVQLTASRNATNDDNGKILYSTSGSPITLTVPDGLTKPFGCTLKQEGAGKISVAGSGTAVIRNIDSHTGTAGQWASAAIDYRTGNDVVLMGRTS